MTSEDDTTKIKKPRDLGNVLVGALAFALGGGTGTVSTLAVTKASVDRLTIQVEKLETRMETVLVDRITRVEVEAKLDRVMSEMDKLREEFRKGK